MTIRVGPRSREILAEVGISTQAELEDLGVVEAFCRARAAGFGVTLNFLWGLEATVTGVDWRELDERRKSELRAAVNIGR